jgi:hypothetical protein
MPSASRFLQRSLHSSSRARYLSTRPHWVNGVLCAHCQPMQVSKTGGVITAHVANSGHSITTREILAGLIVCAFEATRIEARIKKDTTLVFTKPRPRSEAFSQ